VAAELEDAGVEGQACAGRGALEDQRDTLAGQDVRAQRGGLQLDCTLDHRRDLGGAQLEPGEEVARQAQQCTFTPMRLRVLSWNLKHGRSMPPAGRDLLPEFTAALREWDWDVALLQEVPPWWPRSLADSLDSEERTVLTSRNGRLALRQAVATRWPDVIKSNWRRRQRDRRTGGPDRHPPPRAALPAAGAQVGSGRPPGLRDLGRKPARHGAQRRGG